MGKKAAKYADRTALRRAYASMTPVALAGAMNEMRERMRTSRGRFEQGRIRAHKAAIRFHLNVNLRERQLAYRIEE
jgi:hypothetical protein